MKRSELIKIISDFCNDNPDIASRFDKYRLMNANILLHKLEEAGMFYCPVEEFGEFKLRTPKGWEPETNED